MLLEFIRLVDAAIGVTFPRFVFVKRSVQDADVGDPPNSLKEVLCIDFRPQNWHYSYTWSPEGSPKCGSLCLHGVLLWTILVLLTFQSRFYGPLLRALNSEST